MEKDLKNMKNKKWWLLLFCVPMLMVLALNCRQIWVLANTGSESLLENFIKNIFYDFNWRWQECAYILRGINPVDVIHGRTAALPEIGAISEIAGAFPWAYFWGIPLTFAFLPYPAALWLGILSFAALVVFGGVYWHKIALKITNSREVSWVGVLLFWSLPCFFQSFLWGNYGFFCGFLTIAAVLMEEEKPVQAGLLLGLASIKPQMTALFFLALLIKGRWKTICVGAAMVFAGWAGAAAMCRTSPVLMLKQTFEQSMNTFDEKCYFGLFTGVLPRQSGMMVSMLLCIALTAVLCFLLQKYEGKHPYKNCFYYSVPAVFSVAWTYSNSFDASVLYILYLLMACTFWEVYKQKGFRLSLFVVFMLGLLLLVRPEFVLQSIFLFWEYYIPGSALDQLFQNNILLVIRLAFWGMCWLCMMPGKMAEKFREWI